MEPINLAIALLLLLGEFALSVFFALRVIRCGEVGYIWLGLGGLLIVMNLAVGFIPTGPSIPVMGTPVALAMLRSAGPGLLWIWLGALSSTIVARFLSDWPLGLRAGKVMAVFLCGVGFGWWLRLGAAFLA